MVEGSGSEGRGGGGAWWRWGAWSHPGLGVDGAERDLDGAQPVALHPGVDRPPVLRVVLETSGTRAVLV